ncbi:MAG: M48 family metallopeptidase [Candidatus Omnitrophica bacterium]|nr:M48 family metallopeptidase [Candidatus Omnitrophota bacterium]MDD5488302.1 M48 family metallopeptidase [Candidatus Omnitrophota bacterium]
MDKPIKAYNKVVFYQTEYRKVKHPRLEFKTGILKLIVPKDWKETEAELLLKHEKWIMSKHDQIEASLDRSEGEQLKVKRDIDSFKGFVRKTLDEYLKPLKIEIKRLDFKTMKTKWASCSQNRIITVNALMRYLPDNLVKYVLFHEIAHLEERKHNKHFWNIIEKKFKNPKLKEQDLMMYWFLIQKQVL